MDMPPMEWEGELKWFVTGRCRYLLRTERRCSTERCPSLTDVEEATAGAADHIDRCASEPLSDVKGLFGALNGESVLRTPRATPFQLYATVPPLLGQSCWWDRTFPEMVMVMSGTLSV
eukprot:g25851.t1